MKSKPANTTDHISSKIAADAKPPDTPFFYSPVEVVNSESKKLHETLGIAQERIEVLGGQAADALKGYMEAPGKERSKAKLLSEACQLCTTYNEVAYLCYMLGSQIEQMPAMADLAAMVMLGGASKKKGTIIIPGG